MKLQEISPDIKRSHPKQSGASGPPCTPSCKSRTTHIMWKRTKNNVLHDVHNLPLQTHPHPTQTYTSRKKKSETETQQSFLQPLELISATACSTLYSSLPLPQSNAHQSHQRPTERIRCVGSTTINSLAKAFHPQIGTCKKRKKEAR